ncbi:hypothetical protein HMPREF1407_01656 [Helicobacter pylori GAM244Ai]|nr:hypothetical protein HMPREF1407_01656 [Helicobacter pylori GAM244Ai]
MFLLVLRVRIKSRSPPSFYSTRDQGVNYLQRITMSKKHGKKPLYYT